MEAAFKTHIGCIRAFNEDAGAVIKLTDECLVTVVADGMGGHQAGNVASLMAVDIIRMELSALDQPTTPVKATEKLKEVIAKANASIWEYASHHPDCHGMGTTIAVCVVSTDWLVIGHVGDSRIYRVSDGEIRQLTEDHSLVNELLKSGQISQEEAYKHPQRNVLLRALGTEKEIQAEFKAMEWEMHDLLLLCSDGLSNKLTTEEMGRIITTSNSPESAVDQLIELALEKGGEDNISAIVVDCRQRSSENEVK
jgi:serine/threonine protein phosphatase PrpC